MEGSSPGGSRRFVRVSARDRRASEGSGRVRGACPAPGGGANAGVAREMPTFEQGLRGAGGERGGDHPDRDVNPTVHRSEPDRASRTGPKAAECGDTPGTTSTSLSPDLPDGLLACERPHPGVAGPFRPARSPGERVFHRSGRLLADRRPRRSRPHDSAVSASYLAQTLANRPGSSRSSILCPGTPAIKPGAAPDNILWP